MVLWIALYLMEKVYQEAYVQQVFVENKDPPSLVPLVVYAVAIDVFVMALIFTVLVLVKGMYKTDENAFILDVDLLKVLAMDYAVCTVTIVAMGALLARATQNTALFRYNHDGLRGIRALCNMVLAVGAVIALIPFFRLIF
jgi:hypothetical protein